MEILLAAVALIFVILSFFSLLKSLLRILAAICFAGALIFWYNGGREKVMDGVEASRRMVLDQADGLVREERQLLEDAMRDPARVLGPQKERVREITGKLLDQPEISGNQAAREALERLNATLND